MKILLATYWYLPHVGGVSAYVDLLREEFEARGHFVDVLAHHPDMTKIYMPTTGRYIDKPRVKDYTYNNVLQFFRSRMPLVDDWIRWREIERYTYELCAVAFNIDRYDIIHTQDIISTRALARVRPRHGTQVATIHGALATEHLVSGQVTSKASMSYAYAVAEEFFGATSAHKTMVPCAWLRNLMTDEFGVPAGTIDIVPYGMDVRAFLARVRRIHPPVSAPAGVPVILCPARLVPVKGHRYLFEAIAQLRGRDRFVVWLAGSGRLEDECRRQVSELGIEELVVFLGDRDDVPGLMNRADIIVLPSVQDALPFVVMEAQVVGRPIVASRVGGIPEMIDDGRTGFLVQPADPKALASQLEALITDSALRRKIGRQAAATARSNWSPTLMADRVLGVYEQALAVPH